MKEESIIEEKDILAAALRLAVEDLVNSKDELVNANLIEAVTTSYINAAYDYLQQEAGVDISTLS